MSCIIHAFMIAKIDLCEWFVGIRTNAEKAQFYKLALFFV